MPEPKHRRWFQLHLSTCVVLMFVAGGLVWANTRGYPVPLFPPVPMDGDENVVHIPGEGWPFCHVLTNRHAEELNCGAVIQSDEFDWTYLGLNAALALTILVATTAVLEWHIRRRAALGHCTGEQPVRR